MNSRPTLDQQLRQFLVPTLGIALSLFVLVEVNYANLAPMSRLALFAMLGLILCFLTFPVHPKLAHVRTLRWVDVGLALLAAGCFGYILYDGDVIHRGGRYTSLDVTVGVVGIVLVLEAARRALGLALPLLALVFIGYAVFGPSLPDWLFPHRGYNADRVVGTTFLRTAGIFGTALDIMFKYVYLFVLFGTFLTAIGATQFIIDLAQRLFGNRPGGPAKVSALASGLMGSLSGSAVANAATTGTFTIPTMKSIGFRPHIAGGIEAATSAGGALVPPVMGAGAYMMLEVIDRDPPVTYLEVMRAAIIPAVLYYISIFLLIHFYAHRIGATGRSEKEAERDANRPLFSIEGITFLSALGSLILFLVMGYSPFRAVTYSLGIVVIMMIVKRRPGVGKVQQAIALSACVLIPLATKLVLESMWESSRWSEAIVFALAIMFIAGLCHPTWRTLVRDGLVKAATSSIPLIVATACVGIIIGVVTLTGLGSALPNAVLPLAENSLFLALLAIMGCSIVLGMGVPSAVSYLLLATIVGPVLVRLDVPVLAAHMFIFYFGLMAMVTPPVALAAYATASIADAGVMRTGLAAFRFALVGFTLPFMFVYRPELLLIGPDGGAPAVLDTVLAVAAAVLGVTSLAAAMAGFFFGRLSVAWRAVLFVAAACALFPDQRLDVLGVGIAVFDVIGAVLLAVTAAVNWRARAIEPQTLAAVPVTSERE
ncbi:MAG: TRAP transporter fused permease subunit [Phycisphaeraceae bacterium]